MMTVCLGPGFECEYVENEDISHTVLYVEHMFLPPLCPLSPLF